MKHLYSVHFHGLISVEDIYLDKCRNHTVINSWFFISELLQILDQCWASCCVLLCPHRIKNILLHFGQASMTRDTTTRRSSIQFALYQIGSINKHDEWNHHGQIFAHWFIQKHIQSMYVHVTSSFLSEQRSRAVEGHFKPIYFLAVLTVYLLTLQYMYFHLPNY